MTVTPIRTLIALLALAVPAAAQTPAVFAPGVVSTGAEEYRLAINYDGKTMYFARSERFFPESRKATIYSVSFQNGAWTNSVVAPFSGKYPDIDPFVSADGNRLFFSSIRPVSGTERSDADIWVVEKTPTGWGEPKNVSAVNSASDELFPSVGPDGTIYFASDRPGGVGGWDLYSAVLKTDGSYAAPVNLQTLNTELWEFNPVVSPDGRVLFFTMLNQPRGRGLGDLYRSFRYEDKWLPAHNLGDGVNTAADEYHPSLSPNGKHLFFVRRSDKGGDVYTIALSTIKSEGEELPAPRPKLGKSKSKERDMPPGQPGPDAGPVTWPTGKP